MMWHLSYFQHDQVKSLDGGQQSESPKTKREARSLQLSNPDRGPLRLALLPRTRLRNYGCLGVKMPGELKQNNHQQREWAPLKQQWVHPEGQ